MKKQPPFLQRVAVRALKTLGLGFNQLNVDWYARHGFPELYTLLGGGAPAWSGETVSESTALNHSVVWACTARIAVCEAMLPLNLMQRKDGGRYPVEGDPLRAVLHDEPNDRSSAFEFRETETAKTVLRGNAYSEIFRRSSTEECVGLEPLASGVVVADNDKAGRLVYVVDRGGKSDTYTVERSKPHKIFHLRGLSFDGIRGKSVIEVARQSIGTALSTEKYAGTFYANGGRTPYLLKLDKPFKDDQHFDKFRSDWEGVYRESHRAPIVPPGITYEQIGLSPEDSQFLDTRQAEIPEVCRWFMMSPHMVGDLSRATFSNIEHLFLEFKTLTMMAWLVRWEQAIYRCLLTPEQKAKGYYAKHNVNALERGDFASRMTGYSIAHQNGFKNIDEIRALEDENPLPNQEGARHIVQLNMQRISGKPLPSEIAAEARMKAAAKASAERAATPPPAPPKQGDPDGNA
jgi:HK97 family phage portal protein